MMATAASTNEALSCNGNANEIEPMGWHPNRTELKRVHQWSFACSATLHNSNHQTRHRLESVPVATAVWVIDAIFLITPYRVSNVEQTKKQKKFAIDVISNYSVGQFPGLAGNYFQLLPIKITLLAEMVTIVWFRVPRLSPNGWQGGVFWASQQCNQ